MPFIPFLVRHPQGKVVVDEFGPAEVGKNSVAGGQLNACLPLRFAETLGTTESFGHFDPRQEAFIVRRQL